MTTPGEILRKISGGKVLDVATGSGGFVRVLIENLLDFDQIIGIDTTDRGAAAFAAAFNNQPHIRFVQMDAVRLGWPDNTFDTVCISNSLHHLPDLARALAEFGRVLKPGGHMIISEMYRDGQTAEQQTHVELHHWWAAIDTAQGIVHQETYTRSQIVACLDALNWQSLTLAEDCDLSSDPRDPALLDELNGIIDRYIERAVSLPGALALQRRGEQLRQRAQQIGFHGATTLLVTGQKPAVPNR